ncbi:MAG: DUF1559 domain-containing protein [Pirellulaceae bacterium]
MKGITLAMLIHERDHGALPPAYSVDEGGEPLHSWRVLLLPYLGQKELYEKIRLCEPWDSEYNRQFHEEAVQVYRCPSDPVAAPGQTSYSVVVGPDVAFEGGEGRKLKEFGPTSNDLILLVERATPVGWMDPTQEIPQAVAESGFNNEAPASGIGSQHQACANFGFGNGAVQSLIDSIEPDVFQDLLHGTNTDPEY